VCLEDGSFRRQVSKSGDQPLSVREAVQDHIQVYDRYQQCGSFRNEMSRTYW
jgi:hypothetical protein